MGELRPTVAAVEALLRSPIVSSSLARFRNARSLTDCPPRGDYSGVGEGFVCVPVYSSAAVLYTLPSEARGLIRVEGRRERHVAAE